MKGNYDLRSSVGKGSIFFAVSTFIMIALVLYYFEIGLDLGSAMYVFLGAESFILLIMVIKNKKRSPEAP